MNKQNPAARNENFRRIDKPGAGDGRRGPGNIQFKGKPLQSFRLPKVGRPHLLKAEIESRIISWARRILWDQGGEVKEPGLGCSWIFLISNLMEIPPARGVIETGKNPAAVFH
jgi:hypothetical protein